LKEYPRLEGADVYKAQFDLPNRKVTGYAARGAASGYSSTIKLMVGVEPLGEGKYRILGIKVISQQETPGLGARVNDVYTSDTLWTALEAMFAAGEEEKPVETPKLLAAAKALNVPAESFPARPRFQEQFAGKVVVVKGDKASGIETGWDWKKLVEGQDPPGENTVAAMTGATISSKAVIAAVYNAVKTIHKALAADTANSDN
jgi:Na+-translocating ferredoxin:NAD+ oxidoreductase RnfG subunit